MQNTPLAQKIKNLIGLTGPIGTDIFMQMCLYDAEYGYYKTQKPIGKDGDFITAPEISQMFGEIIGIWLYLNWQNLGAPQQICLLELGAGRATLMIDTLRSFRALAKTSAPEIRIAIIETNRELIDIQKQKLFGENANWFDSFANFTEAWRGTKDAPLLVLANEFFDCFPIKQFMKANNHWHEKQIGIDKNDELFIGLGPAIPAQNNMPSAGIIFETASELQPLLLEIFSALKEKNGAMLIIDYGYHNEYSGDTLQALYRHEKCDILENIGNADLTAHVDFGAIAFAATSAKIAQFQIESQRDFLCKYGIEARKAALIAKNPNQKQNIENDLERLIGIDQMGELFKVFECIVKSN